MAVTEPANRPLSAHDPRIEPWRAFLLAHARVARRLDEELRAEHDLSVAEYDALLTIAQAPGRRIRMGRLADQVVLSKSGVTRLIDRLVADGLVERSACLTDARGAEAVLTERGPDAGCARRRGPTCAASASTSSTSSTTADLEALERAMTRRRRRAGPGREPEHRASGRPTAIEPATEPSAALTGACRAACSPARAASPTRAGCRASTRPGSGRGVPGPLRGAAAGRRAEQHLLRVAVGRQGRRLGRGHAGRLPILGQGPARRIVPLAPGRPGRRASRG